MRFLLFIFFFLISCSSSKSVFICGDHECINKQEAEQFFNDNLTIEVRIENKKKEKFYDLVKLNMKNDNIDKESIKIAEKKQVKTKKIRKLSKKETNEIKKKIKEKKIAKKNAKKVDTKKSEIKTVKKKNETKAVKKQPLIISKPMSENICQVLEKCNINEVAEYLTKAGLKKGYPNLNIK